MHEKKKHFFPATPTQSAQFHGELFALWVGQKFARLFLDIARGAGRLEEGAAFSRQILALATSARWEGALHPIASGGAIWKGARLLIEHNIQILC